MGNRLIKPPEEKSNALNKSFDLGTLKNKFSGKRLFRLNFYNLVTGNFSVLTNITNKWFLEQIIEYSHSKHDINLLPALKKIAADSNLDESIRQRASEIHEIIQEQDNTGITTERQSGIKSEEEKFINARKALAGQRFPQTTEILRLLRDKSPELKRLALYIIGKFRVTDMAQEVCGCLNIPGIDTDACIVLQTLGSEISNDLRRFYLSSSGNISTSKAILRILGKIGSEENTGFLLSMVWSNSRQIKETALKCLVECGFKAPGDERDRFNKLIYETFGLLTWILSAKVCLDKNYDNILMREMDKEYNSWSTFLYNLLIVLPDPGKIARAGKDDQKKSDVNTDFIPAMIEIVFHDTQKPTLDLLNDLGSDKKTLKKLNRYFPGEIPRYKDLLEDLINRDYNLINIWTKVCCLKNIAEIDEEDLAESVVALLFSPEEILQEEAARLIARSGKELYKSTSERIPDLTRKRLDKIISGETSERELLYEKVVFLTSCFSGIQEEDLLFLAEKMVYIKNFKDGIPEFPADSILWLMSAENPIPEVYIINGNSNRQFDILNLKANEAYGYILPFDIIEEFHFQYPDRSFEIFKYIDNNEE